MSLYVLDQAHFGDVDLLQAGFDKASAGVGVVVGELLLHLADAQSVGDQLVGVHANLIFARRAAEAGHIDDIRNGLEILLDHPVFDRLQLHHVVRRVGAVQREEIDLACGAPVGLHLRRHAARCPSSRCIAATRDDVMALKSIEDWVVEKNFKSVAECRGCGQLRRVRRRNTGFEWTQQADGLRTEHRPGGAAASPTTTPTAAAVLSKPVCNRSTSPKWGWSRTQATSKTPLYYTKTGNARCT